MNTLRIFNHYVHGNYLLLGCIQAFLLIAAVFIATQLRFLGYSVPLNSDFFLVLPKALVFAGVVIAGLAATGVYHPQQRDGHLLLSSRVLVGLGLACLALTIVFYILPQLFLGRGLFAIAMFLSGLALIASQSLFFMLVDFREAPWRVLFYGAGNNAATILAFLRRRSDQRFFNLVGCIPISGETPAVATELVSTLQGSLFAHARSHGIDEIVVAMDDERRGFPVDDLLECRLAGINVIDIPTFYERQTGKIKTEVLRPSWMIFTEGFRRRPLQDMVKRVIDLVFASLLLLLFSPVILAIVLAIVVEDGWSEPIFFTQRRVGRGGQVFTIYKFRSMRGDAEMPGEAQWATEDDPRVTRVGRVLRKYRLDELPQLLNVLKGEMSMVGPRPERPEFVEQLAEALPYYRVRHRDKPGITGWAQLGYPYGASEDDANGKLQLDLYYVKNRSTFLDLLILLGTAEVVLFRKGGR